MPAKSNHRLTKRIIEQAQANTITWDSEMRGLGLRVTPAGTRSFVIQYRLISGQQRRLVIGSYPSLTVEEARVQARIKLAEVDKGYDPAGERASRRAAPTLRDRLNHYCDEYGQARPLKPRTIKDARYSVERHALPSYGHRKITDFAPSDIQRLHGSARKEAGVHQANRLLAVLSKIFSLAVRDGLATNNPCKGISKYPEDQRWRNFSEKEVTAIIQACSKLPDQAAANAVRLLLFTGARLQEVLKAEWSQFDLERGIWTKPSSHTKQKMQHVVCVAGPALDILRDMREEHDEFPFLFPGDPARFRNGDRTRPRPRADLKRPWDFIVKEAKLTDARRHDLRRTTASFMLDDGVPLATIGKALGHTQVATTARYAHLRPTVPGLALRTAAERMIALGRLEHEGDHVNPRGAGALDGGADGEGQVAPIHRLASHPRVASEP